MVGGDVGPDDGGGAPRAPLLRLPSVYCRVSGTAFLGDVLVSPGELVFESSTPGQALLHTIFNAADAPKIVHHAPSVTIVTGRMRPPVIRKSGLIMLDESASGRPVVGVVFMTARQTSYLADAASRAGFDVGVYVTRFSAGEAIGSVAELARFRRNHEVDRKLP